MSSSIPDLKGTIKGLTYSVLFIVAAGFAAFIYVGTMESDDSSSDSVDVEIIGSKGKGRGASSPAGRKGTTPRGTTSRPGHTFSVNTPAPKTTERTSTIHPRPTRHSTQDSTTRRPETLPTPAPYGTELATKLINDSLNWAYKPCDNFYEFVCSRFRGAPSALGKISLNTHNAIKTMLASIEIPSSGQTATEKAAGLFQACINLGSDARNSEAESLRTFLWKLGLDVSNMTSDHNFDITQRITQLSLEYGFPAFVKFTFVKQVHATEKTLEMWINQDDEEWMQKQYKNYDHLKLVRTYINELDIYDPDLDTVPLAQSIIRSEVVVKDFIKDIRRRPPPGYRLTVGQLGSHTRNAATDAHWVWLITHYTEYAFTATDKVLVWENTTGILDLLMDDSRMARGDSRLLLAWSLLRRLLPFSIGQKMMEVATSKHSRQRSPVAEFCYQTVSSVMAVAAAQRYFRTALPPSFLASAKQVSMDVISALKNKINDSDWIQGDAWCMMYDKAENLLLIAGFPDGLSNESLLEAHFADYPEVGSRFFDAYLESHRLLTKQHFSGNVTPNLKIGDADAAYDGSRNAMTIYAGMMQPPVFIHDAPAAVNYGGLGQIAGHELMHAYDVQGMEFDYKVRRVRFNNSRTMQLLTAKVLCLRFAYLKAESHSRARTTDDITDSEGFADFAGIQLAYAAYRSLPYRERQSGLPDIGLTADQTFFVSHCLKWCSTVRGTRRSARDRYWHSRSRCIVPLQNMPQFAEAFSCRRGDFMNPQSRCRFW
ncbi:neprilysin-1-like [Amblyomma americanum]